MKHFLLICALAANLLPQPALAAGSLVISQVQVSGPIGADDEYVEIHNPTGGGIALGGWSLQYKSATGDWPLSAKKNLPDVTVPAGGYYLIANSGYAGATLPDLVHSAFSLSGSSAGATVLLSSSAEYLQSVDDPAITDRLGYGTSTSNSPEGANAPLPAAGQSLKRISDVGDNLTDFTVGTSEPRNSSFAVILEPLPEEPAAGEPEPNDPELPVIDDQAVEEEEEVENYPDTVSISEIMPNPPGADPGVEWVELFNSGSDVVSLDSWILDDGGAAGEIGSSAYTLPQITIPAGGRPKINIPAGKFALNNTGTDSLRLFWPDGQLVAEAVYSEPAKDSQSWCRLDAGFAWCQPTPGQANAPWPEPEVEEEEDEDDEDRDLEPEVDYSKFELRIISFLPDPPGPDAGHETVTIQNIGTAKADLAGWVLDDGLAQEDMGKSAYELSALMLEKGEETEIIIPKGKFAMNNATADGIRLFSPDGRLEHAVDYPKAKQGQRFVNLAGVWSQEEDEEEMLPEDDEGLVLPAAVVESAGLPRSGLPLWSMSFASLPGIWYIGKRKGKHEQTRSHRCPRLKDGQQPH